LSGTAEKTAKIARTPIPGIKMDWSIFIVDPGLKVKRLNRN
jgi:hypothetical protein